MRKARCNFPFTSSNRKVVSLVPESLGRCLNTVSRFVYSRGTAICGCLCQCCSIPYPAVSAYNEEKRRKNYQQPDSAEKSHFYSKTATIFLFYYFSSQKYPPAIPVNKKGIKGIRKPFFLPQQKNTPSSPVNNTPRDSQKPRDIPMNRRIRPSP